MAVGSQSSNRPGLTRFADVSFLPRGYWPVRDVFRFVIGAALVAIVGACGAPPARAVNLPPPVEANTLGPGDIFEVYVYDEPSMSKPFKVAPDGTIDFPLVGTVVVEGKEAQEIAAVLRDELKAKQILKNPSVSVSVKEVNSKKFAVFGQVQKPGQFPMLEGATVTQAISIAGGFTQIADKDRVTLTRKNPPPKLSACRAGMVAASAAAAIPSTSASTASSGPAAPSDRGAAISCPAWATCEGEMCVAKGCALDVDCGGEAYCSTARVCMAKGKVVRVVLSVQSITEGKMNDIPLQAGDTLYVDERVF